MTAVSQPFKINDMSTLGKRLRAARENMKLSQQTVADQFKISRAAVAQWEAENNPTTPDSDKLSQLASLYDVSVDWLLTGQEFKAREPSSTYRPPMFSRSGSSNVEDGPTVRQVMVVSWIQAGRSRPVADPHATGEGDAIVHTTRRLGPNAYALRIRGDSMEPRFHEGDVIIVDPSIAPVHGSFVVVRFDNSEEATFKQLTLDAGRQYLKPLNPRYPIIEIDTHATLCGTWVQTIVDGG